MAAAVGILIPLLGTGLGAALVFFLKGGMRPALNRALDGAAAGIMTAASFFSLLLPALEETGAAPVAAGFIAGMFFLRGADLMLPRIQKRRSGRPMTKLEKLMLAVTVHNVPEGMAVGVAWAGWLHTGQRAALAGAFTLALGIALQNIPEGAIISLPLRAGGMTRRRAFGLGVLSGVVEPAGAGLILLFAGLLTPLLPALLSFAAGAMFSVVVEELIPEMAQEGGKAAGSLWFALGFVVMMTLDVALG